MIALPLPVFLVTFLVLCLSAWLGATRFEALRAQAEAMRGEFGVIQAATLTLLGLIVGFTFSMAVERYDERKQFESAEASAILTAYQRAELLSAADAARVRALLLTHLNQRIVFYTSRDPRQIDQVDAATARLQADLWSAVKGPAVANPSPLTALVVAGMNDVVRAQGDAQAAWWNRIPATAWIMMGVIATCATLLVGIGLQRPGGFSRMQAALPLIIAIAFFLIADIESPRMGIIRVVPENLVSLAETLRTPAP